MDTCTSTEYGCDAVPPWGLVDHKKVVACLSADPVPNLVMQFICGRGLCSSWILLAEGSVSGGADERFCHLSQHAPNAVDRAQWFAPLVALPIATESGSFDEVWARVCVCVLFPWLRGTALLITCRSLCRSQWNEMCLVERVPLPYLGRCSWPSVLRALTLPNSERVAGVCPSSKEPLAVRSNTRRCVHRARSRLSEEGKARR